MTWISPTTFRVIIGALVLLGCWSPTRVLQAEPPASEAIAQKAEGPLRVPTFALEDQFGQLHRYTWPGNKVAILTVADRKGSEQVPAWIEHLTQRYGQRVVYCGVADVRKVPGLWRGAVRKSFRKHSAYPILLDWDGVLARGLACEDGKANVFVVHPDGQVLARAAGELGRLSEAERSRFHQALEQALVAKAP